MVGILGMCEPGSGLVAMVGVCLWGGVMWGDVPTFHSVRRSAAVFTFSSRLWGGGGVGRGGVEWYGILWSSVELCGVG